jgi:hypothetical protein
MYKLLGVKAWYFSAKTQEDLIEEVTDFLLDNGWLTFYGVTFGYSSSIDLPYNATITGEPCFDEEDWRNSNVI